MRFLIPVYAITLLLSAALLFSVQPLYSKMILPMLGGSPQVWNTAMVFFQTMLLGGYAYAHVVNRILPIRAQIILHIVLLGIFTVFLPTFIPTNTIPPTSGNLSFWQLGLMFATIGGPFFILAGSAPLFQAWFSRTAHKDADNPYFLYGASNFGSMSALLAYPFLIEPFLNLTAQTHIWMYAYMALIGCVIVAAALVWNALKFNEETTVDSRKDEPLTWKIRATWLALAFVPSSLMLGVTTFVTTDIASVPLLWIIPLALYVGTFILAFARVPLIQHKTITLMHGAAIIGLLCLMIVIDTPGILMVGAHLIVFFIIALSCHTELAALKPKAHKLTEFYLMLSVGGALGGVFNALIAPQIFNIALEYSIVLIASCMLRYAAVNAVPTLKTPATKRYDYWIALCACVAFGAIFLVNNIFFDRLFVLVVLLLGVFIIDKRWLFAGVVFAGVLANPPGHHWGTDKFLKTHHTSRNFFGILRVIDNKEGYRLLLHGTTNHGAQALDESYKYTPLTYYSTFSPISDVVQLMNDRADSNNNTAQNFAILGLGSGVMVCNARENRHYDLFEIDPAVVEIAQNPDYFTFLSGCGSPYDIFLGDARIEMEKQPAQKYDLVMADAFSSDNIPVHLITREAIDIYLKTLKPDGVLVFHISNNYLDLEPVLHETAKNIGLTALAKVSSAGTIEGTDIPYYGTAFVAFTRDAAAAKTLKGMGWGNTMARKHVRSWTDQYSNIIRVLIPHTIRKRYKNQTKEQ